MASRQTSGEDQVRRLLEINDPCSTVTFPAIRATQIPAHVHSHPSMHMCNKQMHIIVQQANAHSQGNRTLKQTRPFTSTPTWPHDRHIHARIHIHMHTHMHKKYTSVYTQARARLLMCVQETKPLGIKKIPKQCIHLVVPVRGEGGRAGLFGCH